VPIRDVTALADRMAWLIAHRGELPEMGRAARARVLAKFTLAQYGARLVDTYQGILSSGGGSTTSVSPK
jgi:glycosyltransferase involved in cell wall biosynthesis